MRTALYDHHVALGAKIVSFSGWDMPLHYPQGVLEEHRNVRKAAGLFDVSHMGIIHIKGLDAERLLEFLSVNRISGMQAGSAIYTVLCNNLGGCIDDAIIYKVDDRHFFMAANAGNREKDCAHLAEYAHLGSMDVEIEEKFSQLGILALQGPAAHSLLAPLVPEIDSLKPMHFLSLSHAGQKEPLLIARCGYTGAGGYELYGPTHLIVEWWEKLLEKGKPWNILPIGLGARDSLRLEAGFALFGHELSSSIFPK